MAISKTACVYSLCFLIGLGLFSYSRTPFTVETEYKAEVNSTVKVCEEGEWNLLHFMEDKIVTMTATHDQFSIVNMDGRKGMFSDVLNMKYGKLIPHIDSFGHLIDSKRKGNEITVVMTPFTSSCYTIVNEKEDEDLIIDVHVETRMCYYILFFLIINTVAFGFFPKLIIFEIVIFVLNFIYVDAFNYYHPILVSNSLYSQYLAPYFFLPLLTAANGRILFFSHVGIRFVLSSPIIISLIDLFTFCIMLVNHSRHFFFNLGYSAGKYSTRVKHYIYFYIHFFSEALKQWVMVYWKEITIALVVMAITVYIFYPWKLNLTVQIRFGFIVAIIAALVYTDLPLAVHLVLFSIIFMLLLIMLKKAISYSWTYFVRVMDRYKH